MIDADAAEKALGVGIAIIENRETIGKLLKKFTQLLKHGRKSAVVFGPGGVGKSTLARTIVGAEKPPEYIESVTAEAAGLPDSLPGKLLVLPGQARRRARDWAGAKRLIANGNVDVLVHVVCAGFHALSIPWRVKAEGLKLPATTTLEEFMVSYRTAQIEEEIATLKIMSEHMKTGGSARLLTLVTKQDLWFGESNDIHQLYQTGEYQTVISGVREALGDRNFKHEMSFVSFAPENLRDSEGELMAKTAAGYDTHIQVAGLESSVSTLERLLKDSKS